MTIGEHEVIRLASTEAGWLDEYERVLASSALGATSRAVVLEDSRYIADRAALDVDDPRWDTSRVRTGAVMGAVQSGKTASMIGVVARSLDNGVNVVVILAGTQVSLWRQSMDRIHAQLDGGPRPLLRRVLLPNPDDAYLARRGSPATLYSIPEGQAERAFARSRPIIFVAMKQTDHLLHLGQVLHDAVFPAAQRAGVPVRLLVVDDEADDSSIADDALPWGVSDVEAYKQTPRRIVDLWESRSQPGSTVAPHVFATYIAYTATPQANFLQDPQNPLAPRDFVASLRTPGPAGDLRPRTLTYQVPEGLNGWYTGADVYYGRLSSLLCVTSPDDHDDDDAAGPTSPADEEAPEATVDLDAIVDATRAYLVAAAVRLSRSQGRLGPASAGHVTFTSQDEANGRCAPVCSMLIHPSSAMDPQFETAEALRAWWDGGDGSAGSGVVADIAQDEGAWIAWVERYRASSTSVSAEYDQPGSPLTPRQVPVWEELRSLLLEEVVPATTIAVVNSDPDADERPSYSPWRDDDGWHAPRNRSTIFVSGNVMSRGLTLEGLLTTLFTRSTSAPLADTQMQMQRWFGYRGRYIDLCRVFLSVEQLDLFIRYADADHALRSQVLSAMEDVGGLPDFTVLQGTSFRATGKVAGIASRQLRPGSKPFVRHLDPSDEDSNLALVSSFFAERSDRLRGDARGLLVVDALSLLECADLLDRMRYADHGRVPFEAERWRALERLADLDESAPEVPLYRTTAPSPETAVDLGSRSPFVIAAYLRFWSACIDRDVRGLFDDGSPPRRWSLLDRDAKRQNEPRFRVGVRFGAGRPITDGPFAALAEVLGHEVRPMARDIVDGELVAEWGSRKRTSTGYAGDDLFDMTLLQEELVLRPDGARAEGTPGLLLFHLVERARGGAIAVGLSIPSGGPDHVEAVSSARLRRSRPRED